jgi:hypothetical protein
MGFLDKLKDTANEVKLKAVEAVDGHGHQIKDGIEKAGTFVDQKTKGKYSDKIAKGTQKAGEAVDKIDKDADKKSSPPRPAAPNPTPPAAGHEGPGHPHPHQHRHDETPPPPTS